MDLGFYQGLTSVDTSGTLTFFLNYSLSSFSPTLCMYIFIFSYVCRFSRKFPLKKLSSISIHQKLTVTKTLIPEKYILRYVQSILKDIVSGYL